MDPARPTADPPEPDYRTGTGWTPPMTSQSPAAQVAAPPSLPTVVREWGRIGCIGFGGPPTHIRLLR